MSKAHDILVLMRKTPLNVNDRVSIQCINTTCTRVAKAYISLHICTAWPDPLLNDNTINIGSFNENAATIDIPTLMGLKLHCGND